MEDFQLSVTALPVPTTTAASRPMMDFVKTVTPEVTVPPVHTMTADEVVAVDVVAVAATTSATAELA
jgi:hypothetical protein